jgi:hypothetical protein
MVRPREFCRQTLQALLLDPEPGDPCDRWVCETLLRQFAAEDLSPATFERQLRLLLAPELCPHLSAAALRLLACWRWAQRAQRARRVAARRN